MGRPIAPITAQLVSLKRRSAARRLQRLPRNDEAAVQFCVAEYATMMAKVHLWQTFQYSGISLVVVTLTLLAQLLNAPIPREILLWAAALTVALAYVAYQGAMLDGLHAVLYTETQLRMRALRLTLDPAVFGWERFLKRRRGPNPGQWAQWPSLVSLAAGGLIVTYRWPDYNRVDYVGCAAYLAATATVAFLTRQGQELWASIDIATSKEVLGQA